MDEILRIFKIIILTLIVIYIRGSTDDVTSSENEMDIVNDMLMKNEIHDYTDATDNGIAGENPVELVYAYGVWKCGQCEDLDESRLVYTETYNFESNNYVDYNKDTNILQIGLALEKTSCVIVKSNLISDLDNIKRVSGNCAGDVTLSVYGAGSYDVKVYD